MSPTPCRFRQPMLASCAGRQRLGHQRVVVHRHQPQPEAAEQRGGNAPVPSTAWAAAHATLPGVQPQPAVRPADPGDRRVLVDPHPGVQAGPAQSPGQPGRVQQGAAVAVPQPAGIGGRVELGPYPGRVQQHRVAAQGARGRRRVGQARQLPVRGGHHHLAGPLEPAVDRVPGDGIGDLGQVLPAEPVQRRHLGAEPVQAVGQPVGEAGRAEAAVPAGRRPAGPASLEQQHVPAAGSRSLASSAVHSPVNPPPITARSAVAAPRSGGLRRRGVRPVQPVAAPGGAASARRHRPRAPASGSLLSPWVGRAGSEGAAGGHANAGNERS